jgi:hypothetical protein
MDDFSSPYDGLKKQDWHDQREKRRDGPAWTSPEELKRRDTGDDNR